MRLTDKDLLKLTELAIIAVYKAGEIINNFNKSNLHVKNKIGGSSYASQVVTEVDYKSEEAILQTLLPSCNRFDIALLTEESVDDKSRFNKDYFWSIDPLDGTLSFIESKPGYSVSIALVGKDGTPYIGVIYDPVRDSLFHAIKGKGLYKNNKLWDYKKISSTNQKLIIPTDRSFKQQIHLKETKVNIDIFAKSLNLSSVEYIEYGGAALNACWVIENNNACYFKFPKVENGGGSIWDFSASACIMGETDGIVCDIFGNKLDLNRKSSTFMNHKGVIYSNSIELSNLIINLYAKLISRNIK